MPSRRTTIFCSFCFISYLPYQESRLIASLLDEERQVRRVPLHFSSLPLDFNQLTT
jgi:hypothetical protein